MQHVSTIEPWIMCEFLLLMVTVSYASFVPKMVVLSVLVTGSYACPAYLIVNRWLSQLDAGNPLNLFKTHRSGKQPRPLNKILSKCIRMYL
jgi:hypothetical protein